jgi:hypothetical protein
VPNHPAIVTTQQYPIWPTVLSTIPGAEFTTYCPTIITTNRAAIIKPLLSTFIATYWPAKLSTYCPTIITTNRAAIIFSFISTFFTANCRFGASITPKLSWELSIHWQCRG